MGYTYSHTSRVVKHKEMFLNGLYILAHCLCCQTQGNVLKWAIHTRTLLVLVDEEELCRYDRYERHDGGSVEEARLLRKRVVVVGQVPGNCLDQETAGCWERAG